MTGINVSSLPEIAAGAAVLIDPRSRGELRDGLSRLLLSPGLRAELAGLGDRAGHPELGGAPLLLWGMSAGGST